MAGLPMVVADLAVLREVLRGDGSEPVTFVGPHDVEGWIAAIAAALAKPPQPRAVTAFARTLRRKYSRQRMIESYLSLFSAQPPRHRGSFAGLQAAADEART